MMEGYWERLAALGKEQNPYAAAFFQQVCVSDTDAACEREWWPHVDYFFNKCLHLYPGTSSAPGYVSEASMRAGIVAQVGNTTQNMGMNKTWKELCEQRYIVAGSPARAPRSSSSTAPAASRRGRAYSRSSRASITSTRRSFPDSDSPPASSTSRTSSTSSSITST